MLYKYFNEHLVPLSLTNMLLKPTRSYVELLDCIEDISIRLSDDAEECCMWLNKIVAEPFVVDRVSNSYMRFTNTDYCGNKHYLSIYLEETE